MPSPRPTFAAPTRIRHQDAVHHVWGDAGSGVVDDWIYVSSERIHALVFGLAPEAWFRHSEEHRTVFAADEVYHVLAGTLVIGNPETGEVHRVRAGEAVFFRRDTWHHGFAEGPEPLRVLELFSPPPARGTSQAYARTRPYLNQPRYTEDRFLERWPAEQPEMRARATLRVLRDEDLLWRFEGEREQALVGIVASTEHLTAGILRVGPGGSSGPRRHQGDAVLYLLEGEAAVEADGLTEGGGVLRPGDAFFVPSGERHAVRTPPGRGARLYFGVAPGYLPGGLGPLPLDRRTEDRS